MRADGASERSLDCAERARCERLLSDGGSGVFARPHLRASAARCAMCRVGVVVFARFRSFVSDARSTEHDHVKDNDYFA